MPGRAQRARGGQRSCLTPVGRSSPARKAERPMALDLLKERSVPLDKQLFDWRDLVREPISKLDDDAFTRVRVILMNGIENESWIFQHQFARMNEALREPLARVRRAEQHQQTLVNWLLPADQ